MGKAEPAEPNQHGLQPHLGPQAGGELTEPGRQAGLCIQKLACFLEGGLGSVRGRHNASGGPAALSLPLSSHEVSLHPALDLSREEGRMWTHLSLRTHVNETTKSLPNLPLHTGSLLGLLWLLK